MKLDFVIIGQDVQVCLFNVGVIDNLENVAVALNLLPLLYYRCADVVLPEVVIPLFLSLRLLDGRLSSMVLLKQLSEFALMPVFDGDCFLSGADELLFHLMAFLYFFQLQSVKELQGLEFVNKLLFVLVQELDEL